MSGRDSQPPNKATDLETIECLSCPFCAASDLTLIEVSTEKTDHGYQVECDQCQASGPVSLTRIEAQTSWNRSAFRE